MAGSKHERIEESKSLAACDFFLSMPLPAFTLNRERNIYLANQALAGTFGYEDKSVIESLLRAKGFLPAHFSPEVVAQFYELLSVGGRVESWLMRGQTADGRDLTLEITAQAEVAGPQGPASTMDAYFVQPGNIRDAEAFLQKAKKEAELAVRAKNEFLSNISHELRTPLNIIIGMLSLALEDESAGEDLKSNLVLAKDAADGLFTVLNDLITLSNLEARRLASDMAQFSPELLLRSLVRKFSARAENKGLILLTESDDHKDDIFDGGYNLIVMAMEKLVDNAIKFTDSGEVVIRAQVKEMGDGPWLYCDVSDSGPGLDQSFLENQDLFRQGDGSMNRKHGGLGLGLRLASNLVAVLGGSMIPANLEGGGARLSIQLPINRSKVDYTDEL